MRRSALVQATLAAALLALLGLSCERMPEEPAVEYLPLDSLQ